MAPAAGFEIIPPSGTPAPVIAHVPHASTTVPADVRAELLLSDPELDEELLRVTDWYTDELFGRLGDQGATLFVSRLSRLVFDPERFLDDAAEPMAARGQGVVYWRGTREQQLRVPDQKLRERRIGSVYRPYHAALDVLAGEMLERFGTCIVIDCHSFASVPLPSEIDQAPDRPDICLGTDERHTPPELVERLQSAFEAVGLRVARDAPFAGTLVPASFHGTDMRLCSVMIELNRSLYIDEASAERRSGFDMVSATVERALKDAGVFAAPGRDQSWAGGAGQPSS